MIEDAEKSENLDKKWKLKPQSIKNNTVYMENMDTIVANGGFAELTTNKQKE